eukprot:jgi/Botrbrau1/19200/Bobra.0077s0103.1
MTLYSRSGVFAQQRITCGNELPTKGRHTMYAEVPKLHRRLWDDSNLVRGPFVRRFVRDIKVKAGDPEAKPVPMTREQAYQILGISDKVDTSFDDVLKLKKKLVNEVANDGDRLLEIETAYDIILMERMKLRLSGVTKVAQNVKYADVPTKPKPKTPNPVVQNLPFAVETPSNDALLKQSAVFGVLAGWALLQALFEPPVAAARDVAGLQLALGSLASVWFLRDAKRLSFPKAGGLALAGLLLGTLVGSGVQAWLRVDIVPIGDFSSPGILISEFSLIGLWAACTFLR